jgi:cephalosporin-C deacetylase
MSSPDLPGIPEDLDGFWKEAVSEAMSVPLECHRSLRNEFDLGGFVVETLQFKASEGRILNGWLAYPPGARRLPGFVWLAPYGRESMLPNAYGTREGFASMSFNFHGEPAFHQEKYITARGYFADGAESPDSWTFRRMFIDSVIAARLLQAQVEVDAERIGTMGMSQGGGMAIWLGAWCPIVKAVCSDMPFLANIGQTLTGDVYRYPLKELSDYMEELPVGRERVLNTVSYYDTVTQASRCRVPTQVSLGLKDPASRPRNVRALFEALPGRKVLREYPVGHEWAPEMIENNRNWLLENLG